MLLRDKPTLRELNIHPEILKECKEMITNPKYSLHYKKGAIKLSAEGFLHVFVVLFLQKKYVIPLKMPERSLSHV